MRATFHKISSPSIDNVMQLQLKIRQAQTEQNASARAKMNEIRERLKARSIFKVTSKLKENVPEETQELLSPMKSPGIKQDGEAAIHKQGFDQKYEVLEKIGSAAINSGQGANAVVKTCRDRASGKIYAVKISTIDEEHVIYLKRTFKLIKALNHRSIVKYRQLYLNLKERKCRLVMQHLPFPTLRKFQHLPEQEIILVVRQLLEALQYLHSTKLCHRDLKPDNIMYDRENKLIYIIDFGICKRFYERGKRKDMWTPTGTLAYKAPEMLEGGGYNESVDLWAVGVVMFELITGRRPFQSEYLSDTIEKIRNLDYTIVDKEWQGVSKLAKQLVVRLLKDRKNRLTAEDALKDFWFLQRSSPATLGGSTNIERESLANKNRLEQGEILMEIPFITRNSTVNFDTSSSCLTSMKSANGISLKLLLESIEELRKCADDDIITT